MTDKEKIKAEIERLKDDLIKWPDKSEIDMGRISAFEDILLYINSLPEEPISEFMNTESMIESYKQRLISQANGVKNSPLISMCLASYKHGINETLDTLNLSNVQRTIKEWKEEPASEDLEEEAEEYAHDQGMKQISGDWQSKEAVNFQADHGLYFNIDIINAFKAGANWNDQQMMKDVESAEIGYFNQRGLSIMLDKSLENLGFDENDKVKVLIIKEDEE